MNEFEKLENVLINLVKPALTISVNPISAKWIVKAFNNETVLVAHEKYNLDTALTLVLQDLRDMANE